MPKIKRQQFFAKLLLLLLINKTILCDKEVSKWICYDGMSGYEIHINESEAKKKRYNTFDLSQHFANQDFLVRFSEGLIKIVLPPDSELLLNGGGLPWEHLFDHLEIHVPSIHVLSGVKYDYEAILFYYNSENSSIEDAVKEDYIAAIAILFDKGDEGVFGNLDKQFQQVLIKKNAEVFYINIGALFPPVQHYIRYKDFDNEGLCKTKVVWSIYTIPLTMGPDISQYLEDIRINKTYIDLKYLNVTSDIYFSVGSINTFAVNFVGFSVLILILK